MASPGADQPQHDRAADENLSLTRKRQRLSPENDNSSLSSTGSVVVEGLAPEEVGTSFDPAIELNEDPAMLRYSSSFRPWGDPIPAGQQIEDLFQWLNSNQCIEPSALVGLTVWIEQHLTNTREDTSEWVANYLDDYEFFAGLGRAMLALLTRAVSLFNRDDIERFGVEMARESMARLLKSFNDMSIRILLCLPKLMESSLQRRDSVHTSAPPRPIEFLRYLLVLSYTTDVRDAAIITVLHRTLDFSPKPTIRNCRAMLSDDPSTMKAFMDLFTSLCRGHHEINYAWDAIDAMLAITVVPELGISTESARMFNNTQHHLLPTICEKHPKALPDSFHENFVNIVALVVGNLAADLDAEGVEGFYKAYVQTDGDQSLPEFPDWNYIVRLLGTKSTEKNELLPELMSTAWTLQTLKAFIFSDIMDVRNCGISSLRKRLLVIYNEIERPEHPLFQFSARFLRSIQITKYIFGPNSHASIVNHSKQIFCFLAAASAHSDADTDTMWRASTNSVEAEFVKAAWRVLDAIYHHLEIEPLLYIARKFVITPPSKLTKDGATSLGVLFEKAAPKLRSSNEPHHRLITAFISIEIMMQIDESPTCSSSIQLRKTARQELARYARDPFNAYDRDQIFAKCVPNIIDQTQSATTSISILSMFLRNANAAIDSTSLLHMLPVDSMMEEFVHYVETTSKSTLPPVDVYRSAISIRVEVIIRLMALPEATVANEAMESFFKYAYGECAVNNTARDAAWDSLQSLCSTSHVSVVASKVTKDFITRKISTLAPEFITPAVINLLTASLLPEVKSDTVQNDYAQILKMPIWQKIVEAAETNTAVAVRELATKTVVDVLFQYSAPPERPKNVPGCHVTFTNHQIDRLCDQFEALTASVSRSEVGLMTMKIQLLDSVHTQSRRTLRLFGLEKESELHLGTGNSYTLQIYRPARHAKTIALYTDETTKISELAASLPEISGTAENRVLSSGRMIDVTTEAGNTFLESGIHPGTVIQISPRHTLESDLSKLFGSPGPVEEAVLLSYDRMVKILDGPEEVARAMFLFLAKFKPPTRMRLKVVSAETPTQSAFPLTNIWRSIFSLYVLKSHMEEFACLGVANEEYNVRGIRLIVAALTDEHRPLQIDFHIRAVECLTVFLQEQPQTSEISSPIPDPDRFVAFMIDMCLQAIQSSYQDQSRKQLVVSSFTALSRSFRRQHSIWEKFSEHSNISQLYRLLLTHPDMNLASHIANGVALFCSDHTAATEVAEFYTKILLEVLPFALQCGRHSTHFFAAITQVLLANTTLQADEPRVRELAQYLILALWKYEHTESVDLPVIDVAIFGLLKLLAEIIYILKSFKKPLQLHDFSTRIFSLLLFPDVKNSDSRPLVNLETRSIAMKLALMTSETKADYINALNVAYCTLRSICRPNSPDLLAHSPRSRPVGKCSGLTNLGMTCYMNALLQQFFANINFRQFILETPIRDLRQQSLLVEVQKLFARMQSDYSCHAETHALAEVLNIQTENQEDVHGFYEDFLSRLEANMPDLASKSGLGQFFTGKLVSQIKGECGHVSPKTEPFVDLPIIVKNKASLRESLEEFVQGEPLEGANQYKCLACDPENGGKLVNAMRRACLEHIPDNLTFCLKRFTFEAMLGMDGKVNDRFDFPEVIDMSPYTRARLDDPDATLDEDVFELVGVIVHQGTLHLGHYWSYVVIQGTDPAQPRCWFKIEDKKAQLCREAIVEVQRECVGGQLFRDGTERSNNAYVLFYQRKKTLDQEYRGKDNFFNHGNLLGLLPKVPLPPVMAAQIHHTNAVHQRVVDVFANDFSTYVIWLVSRCKPHLFQHSNSSQEGATEDAGTALPPDSNESILSQLCEVSMTYLLAMAMRDHLTMETLDPILKELDHLTAESDKVPLYAVDQFLMEQTGLQAVFSFDNTPQKTRLMDFILTSMAWIKEHDVAAYSEVFQRVKVLHQSYLNSMAHLTNLDWSKYLPFAVKLAKLGFEELSMILDCGYVVWAFEMINIFYDPALKKKYAGMPAYLQKYTGQFSQIHQFLYDILSGPIDMSQVAEPGFSHPVTDRGIILSQLELDFINRKTNTGIFTWIHASRIANWKGWDFSNLTSSLPPWSRPLRIRSWHTVTDKHNSAYEDFAPGKLLRLFRLSGPAHIAAALKESLCKYIDQEDQFLAPVIYLALSFCAPPRYPSDSDIDAALTVFTSTFEAIRLWELSEDELLLFVVQTHKWFPHMAVQTLPLWCKAFLLMPDNARLRQHTEDWLCAEVFPLPAADDVGLDGRGGSGCQFEVSSVRVLRALVEQACPTLKAAYRRQEARNYYDHLLRVVQHARDYFEALKSHIRPQPAADDSDGTATDSSPLSRAVASATTTDPLLVVEWGEIEPILADLSATLRMVEFWEWDPTAPVEIMTARAKAPPGEVRASIEIGSEEEVESSEEDGV